ncbi:nitrate reductase cytochrome c-type subunit [Halomonas campisalis]|uniref:Periplasmic nitrate reductase, electron transfer subunit n=1 Tax=Billgrantia campisalis TaxID=74661 RepID=A0ABS9P683_9GAMM|nr:nitrate reductase cytochrome c-type subunit [Halomonas campisalis]MCG6657286.1 nitrate reductase cytochrome c-type subunit [Halomonas campisalis]MDR5864172.1 nitrate reductase cytochrome c-type subunit [Halomonas campisalis]
MKWLTIPALSLALLAAGPAMMAEERRDAPAPDGLRPGGTLSQELPAPPLAGQPRHAGREVLNYPEQPPVIPHGIRDYQVDLRTNRCLECHSRSAAVEAGAPMVSISHFRDRHQQVLAAVSPDRYFCTQCHVPQTDAGPIVGNTFLTVDEVLREMLERERGEP